ncbi:uncharacterized protein K452DRAFT_264406 [Aplosporella prunicola CBS 121167]|uniref:Formamidopyrimidine-DNA glycosylase catalytic domain-containing protein n=1 Tax=Aplosporella prunicola CBS 121167 TaxID=1176127 RepID=A0A6A6BMR1_9PEZI|nr:uncharacterized protein K452DRAFT_264406 [Aplosporella prunicola CBS 121167]KAF2145410.1 hypothetical protein K452DRAFT_264406 [Aplosporella prunicola CBS 121167]
MPEIGEVARIVHFLKKHVAGKIIENVRTQEDDIIYGKVGTSATAFAAAMNGKKVLDARQQGKYFWMVMDSPPHPVMHLGMSGWIKFSNDDTSYYKPVKEADSEWPPKYWKFILEVDGDEKCEAAFVDPRRLGRIRLVDADGEQLRNTTPLKENGPDPVIDKDILTQEWLVKKLKSKKVPIKALLLDQANISGVGNWVGDEVLYQAKIHPEQYSNTFSEEQVKTLHDSLINVCDIAVSTRGDSSQFPDDWLMKHRWGKGKKDANKLPNGDKIIFLKVGGRTSAVVPRVQKKTGEVTADVKDESASETKNAAGVKDEPEEEAKPTRGKRGAKAVPAAKANGSASKAKRGRPAKAKKESEDEASDAGDEELADEDEEPAPKKAKKDDAAKEAPVKKGGKKVAATKTETEGTRRRSTRNK